MVWPTRQRWTAIPGTYAIQELNLVLGNTKFSYQVLVPMYWYRYIAGAGELRPCMGASVDLGDRDASRPLLQVERKSLGEDRPIQQPTAQSDASSLPSASTYRPAAQLI